MASAAELGQATHSARSEPGLVERAASGDAAAIGDLYAAHLDSVCRYVRFRVRDKETAADITQDVFVKAYRSLDALRQTKRLRAWLFRIAHNAVLYHLRRQTEHSAEDAFFERQPDAGQTPEEEAAQILDLEQVLDASERLTELQRQVIALRFVSDLSVAETAEIMDRTPNAVHNLQHSALAALRRHVNPLERRR